MKDIQLQYHGFKPSMFAQKYLQDMLIKSVEEAPKNSFIQGHFSRNKKIIKGFVQVHSHLNNYYAVAEGDRLKDVTKKIINQLNKKIEKKIKKRLNHDRIGDFIKLEQPEVEQSAEF